MTLTQLELEYWKMISHWVPAYIADGLAKITGKKAIMLRAYDKVHKASKTFTFFTKREWTVSHTCYCNIGCRFNIYAGIFGGSY